MKKLLIIVLGALFLNVKAQTGKTLQGKITEATIFLNGATITELVNFQIKKGNMLLVVDNLPSDINPSRVTALLPEGAELLSISSETILHEDFIKHPDIKIIYDSMLLLENQSKALRFRIDALNLELDLLKRNLYIGGTNTGVNIAELQKATDFYRIRQDDIYNRLMKDNIQSSIIGEKILVLNARSKVMINNLLSLSGKMSIAISSQIEGSTSMLVKYFTFKAAWKPIYDIKVEDVGKPMQLIQKGKILNQTEKDWKNVKTVLSTADPSVSISRPELEVWALDFVSQRGKKINLGYNGRDKDYFDEKAKEEISSNTGNMNRKSANSANNTEVTVSELSNDFMIAEPVNIASGITPQTIVINSYLLNTTYEYTGIPQLQTIPFLIGKTTDWRNVPLSDGPASIYIGKNFIGESYISIASIADTLEISLGRNKKVVMDKRMKEDLTSKSFFGNTITENFIYEITVKNNNANDIVFELWDQVPVSKQEDIVVTVNDISGAMIDEKTGKLTWRFNLKPGEERKINISFSIKYPRSKKVQVKRFKALKCPDF
ncbi:MAG: DUF4139 domain-containing protein [Bacteroidota bacterium]